MHTYQTILYLTGVTLVDVCLTSDPLPTLPDVMG
jgi:hypothetical protein